MGKKIGLVLVSFILSYCISGCWDYREINKLPIVVGIAIDMDDEMKYIVTAELVDLVESGRESEIKSKIIESEGDTLFDAIRNAIRFEAGRLYFGHMEVVVFGKTVIDNGINEVLDFLIRDVEPRMNVWLLVSKEETAAELLRSKSITTEIRTFEINQMIEGQKELAKSFDVNISDFINTLQCSGHCPVIPCMHLLVTAGIETQAMSGAAILKNNKLAGFLDEEETKYFCFVTDRVDGGLLIVDSESENRKKEVTLEIMESKTKIKPVNSIGKISIEIEIHTETSLGEHGSSRQLLGEGEGTVLYENAAENLIKENVDTIVKMMQMKYGADIFGFGNTIYMKYPHLWKEIEHDWERAFRDLEVIVRPTVEIKESGLLRKFISVED